MNQIFRHGFNPLPKRTYDLNRFQTYPHFLMREERKEPPKWRCFAIFSPTLAVLIMEIIKEHQESEYYICDISDYDLTKPLTNLN